MLPAQLFAFASAAASCALGASVSTDFVARNLHTIQGIYNLTVYPNNVPIVTQGQTAVPPGLFAQNATGRVSPVGNFSGFADSIEYFFGLAPLPTPPANAAIYKAEITRFTSGCPSIAASVVYLHVAAVDPDTGGQLNASEPSTTLKEVAFWRFDDDGLVVQYDAWIPNLQLWTSTSSGVNYADPATQAGIISQSLCPQIQERCTGVNQQYSDTASCVEQLSAKPFGDFDEAWGDNDVCRFIHVILTRVRPEVHCPHVGPVGGSGPDNYKCVNFDAHDPNYYTNDDVLFHEDFTC